MAGKKRQRIDVAKIVQFNLVDTTEKLSKTQQGERENVNYLWRLGLYGGMDGDEETSLGDISQRAIARIETDRQGLHHNHSLFCKKCSALFVPGETCTVRTISKAKKKKGVDRVGTKRKRLAKTRPTKGMLYTCNHCGTKEHFGMDAKSASTPKKSSSRTPRGKN
jgi:RNase P subunit RPR2